jgi:hypothetical protein
MAVKPEVEKKEEVDQKRWIKKRMDKRTQVNASKADGTANKHA